MLGIVLIGALGLWAAIRINDRQDAAYKAADGARVLQVDLDSLQQGLVDQQSALRGYTATADPAFLQVYESGRETTPRMVRKVNAEMPAAGEAGLAALIAAIGEWQTWAEAERMGVVAAGPDTDPDHAREGKRLFDLVRQDQAELEAVAGAAAAKNLAVASRRSSDQVVSMVVGDGVVVLMVGALLAVLLLATLRPLERFSAAVGALAAGQSPRIPYLGRRDEVGVLAGALAAWTEAERERSELTATMAEVSSKIELAEILEVAAVRLLKLLAADQIVISIALEEGGFEVVKSLPAPFSPSQTLPRRSPGGEATASRRPVVSDLRRDGWDPALERWRDELSLGPAMAVPLVMAGHLQGVATLLRHRERAPFTEAELARAVLIVPFVAAAIQVSQLFAEVQSTNLELERASRLKSEFLAGMSHELRTPLNSILGFSQLLLDNPERLQDHARVARYLGNINSSGAHLLGLINDVLDLSKIEAGRMEITRERFELGLVAAEAAALVEPLAAAKRIRFERSIVDGVELVADAVRIKQVLINLLSNAVKFTPEEGRIWLRGEALESEVVITVTDSGVGIDQADFERIFEEFRQVGSRRRDTSGTGLGLALTRRFVELHGGVIEVQSELGRGSTFTVRLPREPGAVRRVEGPAQARRTVLVVERDPASAALISAHLEKGGYRTVVARTPEAGLELAHEIRPAAITLDVLESGSDGFSLLTALKADPTLQAIPVVAVSVTGDAHTALALGAVDHLIKPVDQAALLATMKRHVQPGLRPTILIVDDDEASRALAGHALRGKGYRVLEADGGRRGVELATSRRPSAVLVDLVMPEMSGFEVISALRANPSTALIPIIVVTGKNLEREEREFLSTRTGAVLSKSHLDGEWTDLAGWLERVLSD